MTDFSVVLPMRETEVKLLKKNLPYWCLLEPSEIILGLDKPAPLECVKAVNEIALKCNTKLRIIEIEQNPEYKMHQAWARRKCFREAKNDIIFTGDMDLYVYPACLKALEIVGRDNIGLVSLMKKRNVRSLGGLVKNFIDGRIKAYQRKRGLLNEDQHAYFTGLYCIYRPYWLDSEDESSIKNMLHPYDAPLLMDSWGGYRGEDTHLHDQMKKKYRCIYLPEIGAEDQRPGLEERKPIQTKIGMKFAYEGASPITVFKHSLFNLRFHVFRSYIKQLKEIHGGRISSQVYQTIIAWIFSVAVRIVLKKELTLNSILALYMQEFPISILLMEKKGRLFVDIGANRGYYPLLLRNNFERIVCFEPAASFDDLVKNIAGFGVGSKVRAEKIAISNSDGDGVLHLALFAQFNASVAAEQLVANSDVVHHGEGRLLGMETVKKTTLAAYFRNEQFIDLVKVDVGGSEWEVLEGAIPIIDKVGAWVVELYSPNRLEEMQEWFAHFGYRTRILSHSAKTCHVMASRQD
jgi:FkbM family methyltransferase